MTPPKLQRIHHKAMAADWEILVEESVGRYGIDAAREAFREVDRLEKLLSRFVPSSDVSRLAAAGPGDRMRVAPDTAEVLLLARRLRDETLGAFDPGYQGRASGGPSLDDVLIDPGSCVVELPRGGARLDLGAIGKGYAVDAAVGVLAEWDIPAALVQAGESTAFGMGRLADGRRWTIGLTDGERDYRQLGVAELADCALSGSGIQEQGRHIVDPRTGERIEKWPAAWSCAPSACIADALSTAFILLGAEEVDAFCARNPDLGGAVALPEGLRVHGAFASVVQPPVKRPSGA